MCEILTCENFTLEGNKMRVEVPGAYAVLVLTSSHDLCMQVRQILGNIIIKGMGKAYIDIAKNKNRKVIDMSADTMTPIEQLPTLLYVIDRRIKFKKIITPKMANKRSIENWLRKKHQEFGMEMQPQMSSRSRQSGFPATMANPHDAPYSQAPQGNMSRGKMPPLNPQEPQVTSRRQRQSFSIAEKHDSQDSVGRAIGAPVGINAAWRCEK